LENILKDVKKYTKEDIINVLNQFVPCDIKMRKEELLRLAQDVIDMNR